VRKLSFQGAVRVAVSASRWRQKLKLAAKKRREEQEAAEAAAAEPAEMSAQTPPPSNRYLASSHFSIKMY